MGMLVGILFLIAMLFTSREAKRLYFNKRMAQLSSLSKSFENEYNQLYKRHDELTEKIAKDSVGLVSESQHKNAIGELKKSYEASMSALKDSLEKQKAELEEVKKK